MGSGKYLLKKVFQALLTLAFVLVANFFLFRILPGDPVRTLAKNQKLAPEQIDILRKDLGLDQPVFPQQLLTYTGDTLRGNFGVSFITGRPVLTSIASHIWPTILLVGSATILSTIMGIIAGIWAAWRRGSTFDVGSLGVSLTLYSMPEGWLGMMLLILFGVWLGLFPLGGYESTQGLTGAAHWVDVLNHLMLPMMTLALGYVGEFYLIMRASLLEVMGEDFIMTARAKGLRDKLVRRNHAVPNALLPTVTLVVLSLGYVLGGAILIEAIFSYEGLGLLTYNAIQSLDYPTIQGVFLIVSAAVILANLVADIMYTYLDPRVREA